MISKQEQAEFLAEAMPYIKKYNDKNIIVFKSREEADAFLNGEML